VLLIMECLCGGRNALGSPLELKATTYKRASARSECYLKLILISISRISIRQNAHQVHEL